MSFAVDAVETKHEKKEALAKNMSLATHTADSLRRHEKKVVDVL